MDFFLKGLVHGFCPKIELCLIAVFHRNHIRKDRFWYCGKKRMILNRKNWSFKKVQIMDIFKGISPWRFVQKSNFFLSAFFPEILSENIVLDNVERKEWFQVKKMEVLKRARKWTFSKGVSPWIFPKNRNFSYGCFLQKLCQKKNRF